MAQTVAGGEGDSVETEPARLPDVADQAWMASPQVYQQLKKLARSFMSRERHGHTLLATDLAHNAYLRLFEQNQDFPGGRAQFVALAATMMRRILINYALSHKAQKRGDGMEKLTLSAAEHVESPVSGPTADLLALDQALEKLKGLDERLVTIIELRYFSGLTIEETAEALDISPATVKREWGTGKLWLKREIGGD